MADQDDGKLTLSLRLGEEAIVETPTGDVRVKCVKPNGEQQLSIQIMAPRAFNIKRSHETNRER